MRTKSVEQSIRDTEEPEHRLRKSLGALDLVVFGIGVIIGTGIFVLTGQAAAAYAGPAIALSFVVSGVACALAALCYAEFASTVPVAGSAYTFSYAAIGEFIAWIIGWDLVLEFTVGAAAVSAGWSGYFASILQNFLGITLPESLTAVPADGGVMNLPAALIALLLTAILVAGITLSSRVNQVITAIKLAVILFFIAFGVFFVKVSNLTPFIPERQPAPSDGGASLDSTIVDIIFGTPGSFGFGGVITGAAIVFFAYVGFDIVATTAEETRNPRRDLPIGIIGSLAVSTVLYMLVALVLTGVTNYRAYEGDPAPMATAFQEIGQGWAAGLVSLGAIAGLTSVIMILMLGQSRVAFAMSRDGLLPRWFSRVHPDYRTPYRITLLVGVVVAVLAAFTGIGALAELLNIGTLFAFILVPIGVIILRRTRPDLPRAFKTPLVPIVPILAALISFYLMLNLTAITWVRFFGWMILGVIIYFLYSRSHSRLARNGSGEARDG